MNKNAFAAYRQAATEVELMCLPAPPPPRLTATLFLPQIHTLVSAFAAARLWLEPALGSSDGFVKECDELSRNLKAAVEQQQLYCRDELAPGTRSVESSLADLRTIAATMHRVTITVQALYGHEDARAVASWCAALGNALFELVAHVEEQDNLIRLKLGWAPASVV